MAPQRKTTAVGKKPPGRGPRAVRKKDQVRSRRVLREMWDKADRVIDEQTARSK